MNKQQILIAALILGGYLLGGVFFCRIIPRVFLHRDITLISEDGNPGAANVFIHCGWEVGLCCLLLDMAKGFLPVFCALKYGISSHPAFVLILLAPVSGHAFSLFHRFRGGKCIAVIFGEMIALLWITPVGLILAGLYIFFSVAVKINPNRKRSIVTFSLFAPASAIFEGCSGRFSVALKEVSHA